MANTVVFFPQTPSHTRSMASFDRHRPTRSSPLAPASFPPSSSPSPVSPVVEVQARRKGQYKTRAPSSTTVASLKNKGRYRKSPAAPIPFVLGPITADAGQTAFLRERFKAACFERAKRAREKGLARRRTSAPSDTSSDTLDVDMNIDEGGDEADDDDSGFDDELFRRVVLNEKRKRAHAYALSYELDVGSSFDPEMEDPSSWEEDLRGSPSMSRSQLQQQSPPDELAPPLEDLEDDPNFDEFDFDDDGAWADEYIASLQLDSTDAQPHVAAPPSDTRHDESGQEHHMDVSMD